MIEIQHMKFQESAVSKAILSTVYSLQTLVTFEKYPNSKRVRTIINIKMEMSTAKTITVFVIIFGCFTVLYPKIFHPMLMHAMGFGPKRETANDNGK